MAAHDFLSTFVLGFLPPLVPTSWWRILSIRRTTWWACLFCMHSSEQVEVALVAYLTRCLLTPYFWPEGVVGGEGGCSTLSVASTGCPRWCWGPLCSFCKYFLYLDPSLFANFLFWSGNSVWGPSALAMVPVLVQLLVAVLVVEDSTLLE